MQCYDSARLIQIAWQVVKIPEASVVAEACFLVIPSGDWEMSVGAEETHCISKEMVTSKGITVEKAMDRFLACMDMGVEHLVCHNTDFDLRILISETARHPRIHPLFRAITTTPSFCTMKHMTQEMALPYPNGRGVGKWPKLIELHHYLFGEGFDGAHDALEDVKATVRCFVEISRKYRRQNV
jgi:DNA polymerase III subunit epsilon